MHAQRKVEYVHGAIRLGGLGMPNILHKPFYCKPWGIKNSVLSFRVLSCSNRSLIIPDCWFYWN